MGLTVQGAAEASRALDGKGVSAAYWGNVERGEGTSRGQAVDVHASPRVLATMARVTGVTPEQLKGTGREDAADLMEEILRREETAGARQGRHRASRTPGDGWLPRSAPTRSSRPDPSPTRFGSGCESWPSRG